MAALFESATNGGLFFDSAASGAYSSDLDFDYLLSQVGVLSSPLTDDSFFTSNLLDDKSQTSLNTELSWHVEWFDSSKDIVDVSYSSDGASPNSEGAAAPIVDHDQLRQSFAAVTNDAASDLKLKQTEATPASQTHDENKVQKSRITEIPRPSSPPAAFIIPESPAVPTVKRKTVSPTSKDSYPTLTQEELQLYSDVFASESVHTPVEDTLKTISPSLLVVPLTPPPSSPLATEHTPEAPLTVTSTAQEQKSKDKAAMDYSYYPVNPESELYIPDHQFVYPLTPQLQYMDPYVIDMAKSQSAPSYPSTESVLKKRRRVPSTLNLAPAVSNKRKWSDVDEVPVMPVTPEQYKRARLQGEFNPEYAYSFPPNSAITSTFESVPSPLVDTSYEIRTADFSPYDTVMSCYSDNQIQYDQYALPQAPYQLPIQQEAFHTPPVSPFETMGWYAPSRPYMQKTQPTFWNTPRTVPPPPQPHPQYPISPAPTPQKKGPPRRLSLAPQPPPISRSIYPLSPPHSAPPYPVTQQHLLPKLDPYDSGLPVTSPKKDGKKGRKGRNNKGGGGMFINFTAEDKDTILSGVAPSGSSKAKKEKKADKGV